MEVAQPNVTSKKAAQSIPEFCLDHGISRATYYNLRKRGLAPREMEVLGRRLISLEAAQAWRTDREADAARNTNTRAA